MKINMEYPTWEEISNKLGISNIINPLEIYGDTALTKSENPLCICNNTQYKEDLVGIDIPVLLNKKACNSKGIIVILGESPLRNDDNKVPNNNIVFGLPYAVHMDENTPIQSRMYKQIFNNLLSENYSVYLTDIIKVWWKGVKLDPQQTDIDLFKKELEILQDTYKPKKIIIVAFGKKAEKAIKTLEIESAICLPHPSKLNWSTWKLKIFEKAVYSNNPSYATNFYPTEETPTSEETIIEVVTTEINDRLSHNVHE